MDGDLKFDCKCEGHCCRGIGAVVKHAYSMCMKAAENNEAVDQIVYDLAEFPHEICEDGSCSQLDPGGFCKIYASRPTVCNTDAMYDKYYSNGLTKEQFYELSYKSCEKIHSKYNKEES